MLLISSGCVALGAHKYICEGPAKSESSMCAILALGHNEMSYICDLDLQYQEIL